MPPHTDQPESCRPDAPKSNAPEAQLLAALRDCRRQLWIQCPMQMAPWLASEQRLTALKQALLGGVLQNLKILLDEPHPNTQPIIQLINLSRRLSSKCQLRCTTIDAKPFSQLSLISNNHLWTATPDQSKPYPKRVQHSLMSPAQRIESEQAFDRLWQYQTWENPDLRQIHL